MHKIFEEPRGSKEVNVVEKYLFFFLPNEVKGNIHEVIHKATMKAQGEGLSAP